MISVLYNVSLYQLIDEIIKCLLQDFIFNIPTTPIERKKKQQQWTCAFSFSIYSTLSTLTAKLTKLRFTVSNLN